MSGNRGIRGGRGGFRSGAVRAERKTPTSTTFAFARHVHAKMILGPLEITSSPTSVAQNLLRLVSQSRGIPSATYRVAHALKEILDGENVGLGQSVLKDLRSYEFGNLATILDEAAAQAGAAPSPKYKSLENMKVGRIAYGEGAEIVATLLFDISSNVDQELSSCQISTTNPNRVISYNAGSDKLTPEEKANDRLLGMKWIPKRVGLMGAPGKQLGYLVTALSKVAAAVLCHQLSGRTSQVAVDFKGKTFMTDQGVASTLWTHLANPPMVLAAANSTFQLSPGKQVKWNPNIKTDGKPFLAHLTDDQALTVMMSTSNFFSAASELGKAVGGRFQGFNTLTNPEAKAALTLMVYLDRTPGKRQEFDAFRDLVTPFIEFKEMPSRRTQGNVLEQWSGGPTYAMASGGVSGDDEMPNLEGEEVTRIADT